MPLPRTAHLVLASALGLAPAFGACTGEADGNDKQCTPEPAFRLTLRAVDEAPLPGDTTLSVEYGGGVEEYKLADAVHNEENVFCDIKMEDGGVPEGGEVEGGAAEGGTAEGGATEGGTAEGGVPKVLALECKLWTQGAAKVTAAASGYPDLYRELVANQVGKCIKTVQVELVLGAEDGGS